MNEVLLEMGRDPRLKNLGFLGKISKTWRWLTQAKPSNKKITWPVSKHFGPDPSFGALEREWW